jgi:hypothetical protein
MRILLTIVLPLVLPSLLFGLWLAARRRAVVGGAVARWPWLLGAGVLLTAITLFIVSVQFGSAPQGRYVPPRVVNGAVEPGHVAPPAKP